MRRISVLVDGSNVHATLRELDFAIDWGKILGGFAPEELHSAHYFTAMLPIDVPNSLKPLVDYLAHNGWHVITKAADTHYKLGVAKVKGNMDVELACTAMELGKKVTDVILFTGDGDFVFLVEKLQAMGVEVTVVSTCKTQPSMCSGKLRRAANRFIDLFDIQDEVSRNPLDIHIRRQKFLEGR